MTVSLELKLKDVAWLAKAYDKKTMISPFNYISAGGFTPEDQRDLQTRGVITAQGGIAGTYAPLFDVVATADSYASVDLSSGPLMLKSAVLRKDTMSVSMAAEGEFLRWSMPANVEAIAAVLENYTGSTTFRNVELALEGDCDLMVVFSILCDNYRKQVLGSMANSEYFAQTGLTTPDILREVRTISLKPQSLTPLFSQLCPHSPHMDGARLRELLEVLIAQGLVEQHHDAYYLAGKGSVFAGSFLVIENIIRLKLGSIEEGELYTTQAVIIQAGIHDILYLEQRPQGLRVTTLSSQAALKLLRDVI